MSDYEITLPVADGVSFSDKRVDFGKMTSLNEVVDVFKRVSMLHRGIPQHVNDGKTIFHFSETP